MATQPGNVSDSTPPLDYEPPVARARRRFFTPGGWFALSAFCAAYLLLIVLARHHGPYERSDWFFLGRMTLIITGSFAIGIRSARRGR